ncbi:hypothetical protein [Streptomyces sp. NPDC058874]|uniref:hypothetical protein n=1 Tax=unclassified Streptomyces TaxID=2593676 RepID=UPI003693ED9F
MSDSASGEPSPAPVFVDQSGLRGRLLRGFGWPVSVIGAILAVAMSSSLIGMQADAPAMGIPVRPSLSPSPVPAPSSSTTASPGAAVPSSPRAVTRSATPRAKTSAVATEPAATPSKSAAAPSKSAAAPTKPAVPATKPAVPTPGVAKSSGHPAEQP